MKYRRRTFFAEIFCLTCDTPARAFLKLCKWHNGFYACERCEKKGLSVKNNKGNKRRVYPVLNFKIENKTKLFETESKNA